VKGDSYHLFIHLNRWSEIPCQAPQKKWNFLHSQFRAPKLQFLKIDGTNASQKV